ncbi:hypothetical protein [Actinomadura sp. 9N215]|uniref:hypothetical protein n=1 Tax=Actinomadura sp. 9N215 TaxID=3375150 RepID=UPI003787CC1F
MELRGSHRLAVATGAAVLVTVMSGSAVAAARTTETVCGPEVELGSIVYQTCSDVLAGDPPGYGTMPFMFARNRGLASTDVSLTLQYWNYATSSWETDSTGSRTIAPGSETRYFAPSHSWACGQDARERTQATTTVGTGDWSEAVTPAAC